MKSSENIPFAERVAQFWEWFGQHSSEMEKLIGGNNRDMQKLNNLLADGVQIIGDDVYFNIGGDNELTFCVEEQTECFYLYPWLVTSMPDSLRANWTVYPCKQPSEPDFGLRLFGKDIDVSKTIFTAEFDSKSKLFTVACHNDALTGLSEDDSTEAVYLILELVLGEGVVYNYIGDASATGHKKDMEPIERLSGQIKATLESNGIEYHTEPYLPFYTYKCNPRTGSKKMRTDIVTGTTCYMALNDEYLNGECNIYDSLAEKGATALMLILTQPEGMSTDDFLKLRYAIEDHFIALFKSSAQKGMLLGGAYGESGRGYIDLLLYDADSFLTAVSKDQNLAAMLSHNGMPIQLSFKTFDPDSRVYSL